VSRIETHAYIGIDPGLTGAIAHLSPAGIIRVRDLPTLRARGSKNTLDVHATVGFLKYLADVSGPDLTVILEEVSSMPKQGVVSTFTFGRTFGQLEGAIVGLGMKLHMVRPVVWKKAMGVSADKDAARLAASRAFPEAVDQWARKKDHGRAEAALLTLYGARFLRRK
jgi:crossover junction endodeoxyribonuclease RuvC